MIRGRKQQTTAVKTAMWISLWSRRFKRPPSHSMHYSQAVKPCLSGLP